MSRNCLILASLLLVSTNLAADVPLVDSVAQRMAPLDGYVIRQRGEEKSAVYVDLGSRVGVAAGDLLVVLGPDEVVLHPVTGKEITRVASRRAVLGVTRSMDDFAIAEVLDGGDVATGDRVRRFSGLPAKLWDRSDAGRGQYQLLREALPALEWQGYVRQESAGEAPPPGQLAFILDQQGLTVHYGDSWLVATFERDVAGAIQADPQPVRQRSVAPSAQGGLALRGRTPLQPVAAVSTAAKAADLIAYQGRKWLARASGDAMVLSVLEGSELRDLATLPVPNNNRLLALRWWQPDGDGAPLLAVTTWDGDEVEGMLLRLRGETLETVKLNLPYILGAFDIDGDGRREVLLGQLFERRSFYGRYIRRLRLDDERLKEARPAFKLPADFVVLGSVITDLTGDGKPEFAVVRNRKLGIYNAGGKKTYAYAKDIGSGLSALTYDITPGRELSQVVRVYFEMAPLVARQRGVANPQLLVSAARYPQLSAPGIDDWARESWIAAIRYQGNRYAPQALTEAVDQPLMILAAEVDRVLLMASSPGAGLSMAASGGGQLLALPSPVP